MRPLWLAVGVVTCVIFGSTINKCLTCGEPDDVKRQQQLAKQPVDSGYINPISAEPEPEVFPGPPVADVPVEGHREPDPATPPPPPDGADGNEPEPGSMGTLEPKPMPRKKLKPLKKTELPKGLRDHKDITFDFIADFTYEFPEEGEQPKDQIPEKIKAFHGKRVAIKGFMIPIKTEGEHVIEFVLVRNQGACCWGVVPRMNEWIHVHMEEGKFSPYAVDIPITVFGKFEAGEVYEEGIVMSIYRMRASHVVEPPMFK